MEELDIRQIMQAIWNNKILVIVISILAVVIAACYSYLFQTPKYQATTTLVLTKSESKEDGSTTLTTTDVTMNQKLIGTYSEIIKSKSVLGEVIKNLGLEGISEGALKSNITVKSVKDTEVISISVSSTRPEYASKIANEIGKVFADKVADIYKLNNVYTLDIAETPKSPYNIKPIKYMAIAFAIGLVISCGYIIVKELLDTTVKTSSEIELLLGIPVIAQISEVDLGTKGGKR